MAENITPQSRTEALLQNAMGAHNDVIPQSRVEDLLQELAGNSGGGPLIPGVLRSDAELVKSMTYDHKKVADDGVTLPSYSTSEHTFSTQITNGDTYECDFDNYDPMFIFKGLAIPEYSIPDIARGLPVRIQLLIMEYI